MEDKDTQQTPKDSRSQTSGGWSVNKNSNKEGKSRAFTIGLYREIDVGVDFGEEAEESDAQSEKHKLPKAYLIEVPEVVEEQVDERVQYEGEVQMKSMAFLPDGQGQLTWNSKALYRGQFSNGKFSGKGKYLSADGKNKYKGEYESGFRSGEGMYLHKGEEGEETFVGSYEKGKRNGKGILVYPDYTKFEGEYENGLRNGVGKIIEKEEKFYKLSYWKEGKLTWQVNEQKRDALIRDLAKVSESKGIINYHCQLGDDEQAKIQINEFLIKDSVKNRSKIITEFKKEISVLHQLFRSYYIVTLVGALVKPHPSIVIQRQSPEWIKLSEFIQSAKDEALSDDENETPASASTREEINRRDPLQRLRIAKEITKAIHFLHRIQPMPIIHRNLHSSSIFINTFTGKIKLTDFGYKFYDDYKAQVKPSKKISGPVSAPSKVKNCKSDIYALGKVLCELLTNEIPNRELEVMKKSKITFTPDILHKTPKMVGDLIRGCWHYEPSKRPSSGVVKQIISSEYKRLKTLRFVYFSEQKYNEALTDMMGMKEDLAGKKIGKDLLDKLFPNTLKSLKAISDKFLEGIAHPMAPNVSELKIIFAAQKKPMMAMFGRYMEALQGISDGLDVILEKEDCVEVLNAYGGAEEFDLPRRQLEQYAKISELLGAHTPNRHPDFATTEYIRELMGQITSVLPK